MKAIVQTVGALIKQKMKWCDRAEVQFDAEELITLAVSNQIEGLVLSEAVQYDCVEEEQREKMRGYVKRSFFRTLVQMTELKRIADAYEQNEIKNQPMKGSLLKKIYPSPELREMSDIDILVDAECMDRCREVMQSLGYTMQQDVKHHEVFSNNNGVIVEVHKSLYDKTTDKKQYEYFLDLTKRSLRENCSYTYDFTPEDFYIYMIAHMARHFHARGCGVRNLIDVKVYLDAYGDKMNSDYLGEELEVLGLKDFNDNIVRVAYYWLDDKPGDKLCDDILEYMLFSGIYGKDQNGIWNQYAFQQKRDAKKYSSALKRWYMFPPKSYMIEYYPYLQKFPWLLPFTWIKRGVSGLFQHRGEAKVNMINEISEEEVNKISDIYRAMNLHFHSN